MTGDVELETAKNGGSLSRMNNTRNKRNRNKEVWYSAPRDDLWFQKLVGSRANTELVSVPSECLPEEEGTGTSTATPLEVEPFRKAASKLPFALRFILELHLFNDAVVETQQVKAPECESEGVTRQDEIAASARMLVVAFVKYIIPPLAGINWDKMDVTNFTLTELFAEAIGPKIAAAKQNPRLFSRRDVDAAMRKAKMWLQKAIEQCGPEDELGTADLSDIDIIKRRAVWPYAEYGCRFLPNGDLTAVEYEMINKPFSSFMGIKSRRGLRESGWLVRNRFCRVKNSFDFSDNLVDWIASEPELCGRKYQFLFDKGVGSDVKLWLFSEHTRGSSCAKPDLHMTRNCFLASLGKLGDVPVAKVGDRIGLAFSQTAPIIHLSEDQIKVIPELVRNGYAFSDGNGVMGLGIAKAIKEELGLKKIPGAAQIRMGGVKGMLSLNFDIEPDCIGIRRSQVKFPSSHFTLEVKDVAEANLSGLSKLFKETLLVMDHLGIYTKVFYELQEEACAELALEYDVEGAVVADKLGYMRNVLEYGTKSNGTPFMASELESIKEAMVQARDKVNLPCPKLATMFGIVDEYGVLEANQVLVCNGEITGEVLVLRSPCMFPGDIQKARAVPRKPEQAYTCLDQVIVFSSKGDRPMADKLGGGDLDGDKFFVIYDEDLVKLTPSDPHDFGTRDSNIQHLIGDKSQAFFTASCTSVADSQSPSIQDQLSVLHNFLENGNLVSNSAEAWLRHADKYGIGSEDAQKLAALHQTALDSRKVNSVDCSKIKFMYDTLDLVPVPHYKLGGSGPRRSSGSSLLGVLYELWRHNIKAIDILRRQCDPHPNDDAIHLKTEIAENKLLKQITINSMNNLDWEKKERGCKYKYCVECGDTKPRDEMTKCPVCGIAWHCKGRCESAHWKICFGIHWNSNDLATPMDETDNESFFSSGTMPGSFDDSREVTANTVSDTVSLSSFDAKTLVLEARDIVEELITIVFDLEEQTCTGLQQINWKSLDADYDLPTLRQLVLVEFYAGFDKELQAASQKTKDRFDKYAHIFDVFTMDPLESRGNISLAVCVRKDWAGNMLMWRGTDNVYYPMDPGFHKCRVASLSGTCRILESLDTNPMPGTLMDCALRRDANAFAVAEEENIYHLRPNLFAAELNMSQKIAVATATRFEKGFFLVQGPPGTGKTVTLAAMVASVGEAIVVAPSNAAVANVAVKVLSCREFDVFSVVVFGENCDEHIQFLSPIHRSRHFSIFHSDFWTKQGMDQEALLTKFTKWLRLDTTAYVNSKRTIKELLLFGFAKWLHLPSPNKVTYQDIEAHCPRTDDTGKGQEKLRNILHGAKVVLSTLNVAGSSFLRDALAEKHNTLFVDEAAQSPEAEFYVATTLPGIRRIVCIGDPAQLSATVLNEESKHMGYGDSWMKHAMDHGEVEPHLLNIQYRCDPKIIEFSNKQFYKSQIETPKFVATRTKNLVHPMLFVDTPGKEEKEGQSFKNGAEVKMVLTILEEHEDIKHLRENKNCTIMIITPYRAQVNLLRLEIAEKNPASNIRADTVDAFQGKEADVVLLTLVRTQYAGFTDNNQRINVALTRAKHVLRIVGNLPFWRNQSPTSCLRKLVDHCMEKGFIHCKNRKQMEAWLKPEWSLLQGSLWQPNMTPLFHHCTKQMPSLERNVAVNTLIKLAMARVNDFELLPRETSKPCWQTAALKGFKNTVQVVWCAKEKNDTRPIIEAHFAGQHDQCLHFRQTHQFLPKGAAVVTRNLDGIKSSGSPVELSKDIEPSWTLNESIGNAMLGDDTSFEFPVGCFDLDPKQQIVLRKNPPLILESGSGTGKTNVLFQHAVAYAKGVRDSYGGKSSICFATVSPRLVKELRQRYDSITKVETVTLPPIKFVSLRELVADLVDIAKLDIDLSALCTFIEYVFYIEQTKHSRLARDVKEVENEICGVIMGSLLAAKQGRPLTRIEYEHCRSYIKNDTEAGMEKRNEIFSEYEKYRLWKRDRQKKDLNDVILELINKFRAHQHHGINGKGWVQLFNALYLDEVQDFSYASIYLMCNIAGLSSLNWVFAGDTAQMISPGCSFTFAGLKDVLLTVQPSIKDKIKEVCKLRINYRVTKHVLNVSNAILHEAKQHFRHDIQYLRPEVAVKDLGTRVRMCNWQAALQLEKQPRFGLNQALIYSSSSDLDELRKRQLREEMDNWLIVNGISHPFVLTSLDSKGLEFDDCVIAFDMKRKDWKADTGRPSLLRLLRELYVAITRAKKRVVILTKGNEMRSFFSSLDCDIEEIDAKVALLEFDAKTTTEQWLNKGKELFEDENFEMAASCFKAAGNVGMLEWAQGLTEIKTGQRENGKESFRRSARAFFAMADYEHTLDLLSLVIDHPPWNPEDDHLYEESISNAPGHIPTENKVGFALQRNKWNEIKINYLSDPSSAHRFLPYRESTELKKMISSCSKAERAQIEGSLPLLIADYYYDKQNYVAAVTLFLEHSDYVMAVRATDRLITLQETQDKSDAIVKVAQIWRQRNCPETHEAVSRSGGVSLLLHLYQDPRTISKNGRDKAVRLFRTGIIKSAFEVSKTPFEELHNFSRNQFEIEVDQALSNKFKSNKLEAVQWYLHHDDTKHAELFAANHIDKWSSDDLCAIASKHLNPKGLIDETEKKKCLIDLIKVYLSSGGYDLTKAVEASCRALSSADKVCIHYQGLIAIWNKHKSDSRVRAMLKRHSGSPLSIFLNLFWEPKITSTKHPGRCMKLFGPEVVEFAVSSHVKNNPEEKFDILSNFDKQVFERFRPKAKHGSLKLNQAPPQERGEAEKTEFKPGVEVTVRGLRKFEGKKATIVRWNQQMSKYEVKLSGEKKRSVVAASFLKIEDDSSSSSSDDDSGGPPPLSENRLSSSEDDTSDDGQPPELIARGGKSDSSSSEDDSSLDSGAPPLARKDSSSSDDSSIPPPLQKQESSSDDSEEDVPRQAQRGRQENSHRRGGRTRSGRGGRGTGRGQRRR